MADVLLITEQQRIGTIFARAGQVVAWRLRVVPTLAQAEEEIAAAAPTHAFVESTISGVTPTEVLRYLHRLLPSGAKIVLLAAGSDTLDSYSADVLDVSGDDASVEAAIAARIGGTEPEAHSKVAGRPAIPATEGGSAKDLLFAAGHDDAEPSRGGGRRLSCAVGIAAALAVGGAAYHHLAGTAPHPAPPVQAATPRTPAAAPVPTAAATAAPIAYQVQPGDTIWGILDKRFGISEQEGAALLPEIQRINHLKDLRLLKPGQTLLIPAAAPATRH